MAYSCPIHFVMIEDGHIRGWYWGQEHQNVIPDNPHSEIWMENYHRRGMNPSTETKASFFLTPLFDCTDMSGWWLMKWFIFYLSKRKATLASLESPCSICRAAHLKKEHARVHPHFPLFKSFLLFFLLGLGLRLCIFVCQLAIIMNVHTSLAGGSTFFPVSQATPAPTTSTIGLRMGP